MSRNWGARSFRNQGADCLGICTVHEWDERRAAGDVTNVVYAKALLEVTKEEEAARLRIVNHWPCNDQQGWQKLTYLAAYLFATRGSLKPEEMDAVLSTTEPVEWACALA
ncbi:hypothetical protein [Sinorhizobium meliloti]|uniref:hypothetical protein n=1 Tax=Rhizobium meliloti TaxID=382 RepID=UPI001F16303D|nr:hypothetical protein [Sinorhizobium meliloti]